MTTATLRLRIPDDEIARGCPIAVLKITPRRLDLLDQVARGRVLLATQTAWDDSCRDVTREIRLLRSAGLVVAGPEKMWETGGGEWAPDPERRVAALTDAGRAIIGAPAPAAATPAPAERPIVTVGPAYPKGPTQRAELHESAPGRPDLVKVVWVESRVASWVKSSRILPAGNDGVSESDQRYARDNDPDSGEVAVTPTEQTLDGRATRPYDELNPRQERRGGVQLALLTAEEAQPTREPEPHPELELGLEPAPANGAPTMAPPIQDDPAVSRAIARARAKRAGALAAELGKAARALEILAARAETVVDRDGSVDVLADLHTALAAVDELRTDAVELARAFDAPWSAIGPAVGMDRGNAHVWHTRRMAARS